MRERERASNRERASERERQRERQREKELVGALGPVNHRELHQG